MRTIEDWLQWVEQEFLTAQLYYGHGTDNAWDEAVQLVLHVMQLPLSSDSQALHVSVDAAQAKIIQLLTEQRVTTRKPLPYLLHRAWFAGLCFYVDERVLIPRSPLGEWIERRFFPWIDEAASVRSILDVGTGSGCLAIAASIAFPNAEVTAVDINPEALAVAKRNVEQYQLNAKINLIQSDCLYGLRSGQQFDLILANPPYVDSAENPKLPPEYRHEPAGALFCDDKGLAIPEKLLATAGAFLSPDGVLVMEVGNNDRLLQARYSDVPFVWLDCERGGHGVLLLTADQVKQHFS